MKREQAGAVAIAIALVMSVLAPFALASVGAIAPATAQEGSASFGGTLEASGTFTSGSTVQYEVDDLDAVNDYQIEFTGHTSKEWDNRTASNLDDSSSVDLSIGGDLDPVGPGGTPSVRFTGTETLYSESATGTNVGDGSTSTFSVGGDSAPKNQQATFSGRSSTTKNDQSGASVSADGSSSIVTNGNIDPSGPLNGNPKLSITGYSQSVTNYTVYKSGVDFTSSNNNGIELSVENPPKLVNQLKVNVTSISSSGTIDIYAVAEGPDTTYGEGSVVASVSTSELSVGQNTIPIDPIDTSGSSIITFETVTSDADVSVSYSEYFDKDLFSSGGSTYPYAPEVYAQSVLRDVSVSANDGTSKSFGSIADGTTESVEFPISSSASSLTFNANGGVYDYLLEKSDRTATEDPQIDTDNDGTMDSGYSGILKSGQEATVSLSKLSRGDNTVGWGTTGGKFDFNISYSRVEYTEDPAVDIDGDGSVDTSVTGVLEPGESVRRDAGKIDLATSSLDVFTSGGSRTDLTFELRERLRTENPELEINGNTVGGASVGVLADGETYTVSTDSKWVKEGINHLNMSFASSFSADDPAPQVELSYSHGAVSNQTVDYVGEKWSERYAVSKIYADNRTNADVTIPFQNNVVSVRDLELRVDGSERAPIATSLSDNRLLVDVGSVDAGQNVSVQTTGSRVQARNGSIEVVEPTMMGNTLNSRIELSSWGSSSTLEVGGTPDGDRIHYTTDESYQGADTYADIRPGSQQLHLEGASSGSRLNVTTLPVRASPEAGDVLVQVDKAGSEPELSVSPGESADDTVEYTYINGDDGAEYILKSLTNDVVRDSGTANSPVTLVDDDSEETLAILQGSAGSSGGGGGGPPGPSVPPINTGNPVAIPLSIVLAIAAVGAIALLSERLFSSDMATLGLTGVSAVIATLLLGEAFTAEALLAPLTEGLGSVTRFAALIGVGLAAWWFYSNYIKGQSPTIKIAGRRLK